MGPRLVSRGNALPLGTVNALGALLQWPRLVSRGNELYGWSLGGNTTGFNGAATR